MANPAISIIVPVYKTEKYLNRCVDSILSQDYNDFELILVDDGSPDNSGKICDEYAKNDNRIKVIHKENGGVSSARNLGIEESCGSYLMFVDSDDYIEPDSLNLLFADTKNNPDIIIGDIYWEYANLSKKVPQKSVCNGIIKKEDLLKYLAKLIDEKQLNYLHAKLFKRDVILKNNIRFKKFEDTAAEDTVFNFDAILKSESIFFDDRYFYSYIINQESNSLSSKPDLDKYKKFSNLSDKLENYAKELSALNDDVQKVIDKRRIDSATWCIESIMNSSLPKAEKHKKINEILNNNKFILALHNLEDSYCGGQYDAMRSKDAKTLLRFYDEMEYGKGLKGKIKKILKRG
jgi:glycosyltransferase involved in cell wall biosynthesis